MARVALALEKKTTATTLGEALGNDSKDNEGNGSRGRGYALDDYFYGRGRQA